MSALYHKHRPQLFDTIIGQEPIVETLKNQILLDRVAHAYLFYGPRGVGKTTTARVLAKALNCEKRKKNQSEPCDDCDTCRDISASRSIDVIEMDAASHTGVDNVREEIIENSRFKPTRSSHKIFIIDEVHMLSASAFNALLKTIEEPPPHVNFILATTELQKLPETIISRCQKFTFKKIPSEALKKHLEVISKEEGVKVDKDVMLRVIKKSEGCARDAVGLLDQIIASGEKHITAETASLFMPVSSSESVISFAEHMVQKNSAPALGEIQKIVSVGSNIPQFASDVVEFLRVMILQKTGRDTVDSVFDFSDIERKNIMSLVNNITLNELVKLVDLIMKRRLEIKSSPIPQLPLELAVIEWCGQKQPEKPMPASQVPNQSESEKTIMPQTETKREMPKEPVKHTASLPFESVQKAWCACIERLEHESPSLASILRVATLSGSDGASMRITVPYAFHKDQIHSRQSRVRLEKIFMELIGVAMIFNIEVDNQNKDASEVERMAALFGGEVVQT